MFVKLQQLYTLYNSNFNVQSQPLYNCSYVLQNASVIRATTIPNVMLNTSQLRQDGTTPSARFFSGDWKDFADLISTELSANKNKYDCILTSETIYNSDSHQKLLSVFKACLETSGVMYPFKLYL